MSPNTKAQMISDMKLYFGLVSHNKYQRLRSDINTILQKRKIKDVSAIDSRSWNEVLDELLEHPTLRGAENVRTEKEEAREHLSSLLRTMLERKGKHSLAEGTHTTMDPKRAKNGPGTRTAGTQPTGVHPPAGPRYYASTGGWTQSSHKPNEDRTHRPHKRKEDHENTRDDTTNQPIEDVEGSQVNTPKRRKTHRHSQRPTRHQTIASEGPSEHRPNHENEAEDTPAQALSKEDDGNPVASQRAICAYVSSPAKPTPNIVVDFIAPQFTIAELYRIVSSQIGRAYFAKALYGLRMGHDKWPAIPPTRTRLVSDRQVKACLQLFYPSGKENVYIQVILNERGKSLGIAPREEIPYTTEEEYNAMEEGFN
ncbi:MAG: hypothetical protein M1816_007613 [Peltula sp. TS41687]|nr:MAG: hypothetical protein M1816_007613 [Peltula sp. TS41687]